VNLCKPSRIAKFIAVISILGLPTAALAASGSFEMDIPVANVASIEVTNGSGTVYVRGADVDQVTIRARINVDKRYAKRDPYKAMSMVEALKRTPPIRTDGDRIIIEQPRKNTQRRHVSIDYEILVPRDAQVKVHSDSGDVRVSGVSGPVDATSETGVVTLAHIATAVPVASLQRRPEHLH
jgi:hypothetical protein